MMNLQLPSRVIFNAIRNNASVARIKLDTLLNTGKTSGIAYSYSTTAGDFNKSQLQHQEIIEDTREEDELKSVSLIQKVNNHLGSGEAGRIFAVIQVQGKQYRVVTDDVVLLERPWAPIVGDKLTFEKVLLAGGSSFTLIGKPVLPSNLVRVYGTIVHKDLTHTKIRFHHIPKERVHKMNFAREELTYIRISDIFVYPKLNISEHTEYDRC